MTNEPAHDELAERRARIRELNDALRRGETQASDRGSVMITQGVNAHGLPFVTAVTDAVKRYDAFSLANDPHGERDFGVVDIDGETVFWKIDYLDRTLRYGSPDPADPDVTHRVLTIMLASEC